MTGRIACSARHVVASIDGSKRKLQMAGNSRVRCRPWSPRSRRNASRSRSRPFVLVTIPERLAIEETSRAAGVLEETGIEIGALIVNRILPDGLSGEFYRSRKAQEDEYLREIGRRFAALRRVSVRQLPRDVHGLESLGAISDQLFPEGR
jgi:anion-transporting  ArsA/GET3 family ATPase